MLVEFLELLKHIKIKGEGMTKAELLTELANKFYKLGSVIEEEYSVTDQAYVIAENVRWYRAIVFDEHDDGRMQRRAISFFVEDEGGPAEAAFYKERLPGTMFKDAQSVSFRDTVLTAIESKVIAEAILRGELRECNEAYEWAVVRVFMLEANIAVEKDYFVYRKPDTSIGFIEATLKA